MFFSLRDFARILSSTALSNGFLVVLSLLLAKYETPSSFASFAYTVAVFSVGSLVLDFGLNIAALKRVQQTQNTEIPLVFASMKLLLALSILFLCVINFLVIHDPKETNLVLVGLLCAACNNVWAGLRVQEQSTGNAKQFFNANVSLFFVRLLSVACVYWLSLPIIFYLIALYVFPFLVIFIANKRLFAFKHNIGIFLKNAKDVFNYSKWIFLSALLFVVSVQLPVLVTKHSNQTESLAVLGIAMTISSFSSWLSSSLKPFVIGKYLANTNHGGHHYLKFLFFFFFAMLPVSTLVYVFFAYFYGAKYPEVELVGVTIFVYTTLLFAFGLYNGQIHKVGRPELEALINFLRVICVLATLLLTKESLFITMFLIGAEMVVFEMVLMKINYNLLQKNNENSIS